MRHSKLLTRLAGLALALVLAGVAFAQVSPGYHLSWHVFSSGGGQRVSPNFIVYDSVGAWSAGSSASANTRLEPGFLVGAFEATPTPKPTSTPTATTIPTNTPTPTPPAGDAYENDNDCVHASTITVGGPAQRHTFGTVGDVDWIKFTALSQKTYIIETFDVGSRSDAVVELYNGCDAPPLSAQDNPFAPTLRLEFDAVQGGTYYLKFIQHDSRIAGDDTYYHVSVTQDTTPPAAPRLQRLVAEDKALDVYWGRNPERGVVGYRLWIGTASGAYSWVEDVTPSGGDTTFYQVHGLNNGTRYWVVLSAVDFSGNESLRSLELSEVPTKPPDATIPSVTITYPTVTGVYTTTASSMTIGGTVTDSGGNLARVSGENLDTGDIAWDYTPAGGAATFQIMSLPIRVGANQIKVTAFDDASNHSAITLSVNRLSSTPGAVIIVAGRNDTDSLQANIYNATNRAYRVFRGAGFRDEDIYYLAPANQDPNGDGQANEVDAVTSPTNVLQAIQTWARPRVGPGKPLYVYMMNHGEIEFLCANGCNDPNRLTPAALDNALRDLETNTGVTEVNVIYDACHSGSFIDRTDSVAQSISRVGRVIITSTGRVNNAYASATGAYFSDALFTCLSASSDLKTCFDQARVTVNAAASLQTPWMDDNGDGLSTVVDGDIARARYVARFFGALPPRIVDVSVSHLGTTGVLTATVEAGDEPVQMVWAAVYPPGFQEPTTTTLDLGVPLVRLEPVTDAPGMYRVTYPGAFTQGGQYRVVFYAQDKSGDLAAPSVSYLAAANNLYLPLIARDWAP